LVYVCWLCGNNLLEVRLTHLAGNLQENLTTEELN